MTDKDELQSRVGQFEQAISALDNKQKALLQKLQDGLGLARQKLAERKLEIEHLKRENHELRQIVDRLLQSVEGQGKNAIGEQLGALDRELASLMALADDEAQPVADSDIEALAAQSGDDTTPRAATAATTQGEDDDELATTLSDIHRRIQDLAEQFPKGDAAGDAPETDAAATPIAAQAAATETPSPNKAEPPSRPAEHSAAPAYAAAAAGTYPKARGPLDAEVGYALSVLRQMRRADKLFSIEDVRGLINGKFGLDLTTQQDTQIRACLSRRDGVYPDPKHNGFWRFDEAA